jgi:glycosyltransferase involved in cell wall biosynthesis
VRILYLADIRFPLERANGIQTMQTCHALAARGHRVSLAVRPDTHTRPRDPYAFYGLPRLRGSLNIEVVPISGPPVVRRTGYVTFGVGRAMGRVRQDVIFTRDLGLASILVRLPRLVRGPVVYEAHTIAADEAAARHEMLTDADVATPAKLRRLAARDGLVWRAADGYVTITQGLKNEMERRFGPRTRVAVVPDGVRVPDASSQLPASSSQLPASSSQLPASSSQLSGAEPPASNLQPPTFTIGYAGHLYPWKGVELIIEAVRALPETRALIVGGHEQEPDLARIKDVAAQLDCSSRVTFTGLVAPPDVPAHLREADVLVLPNPASAVSSAFTSPLKLFEYMAAGRPIVASDLPSIREVLTHEHNALLIAPGDPQALTAAIRRLKDDAALGARLAGQAREDVAQYTWERRAERLERLFDEVRGS